MKPRIALMAMNVLSEGKVTIGIPVLIDLFTRLSSDFEITYYSFNPIEPGTVKVPVVIREVVPWPIPGRLKFFLLSLRFLWDHFQQRHDLVLAVSIYPTGLWALRMARLVRTKVAVQIIALEAVAIPDIQAGNLIDPWYQKITRKVCEDADALIAVADEQRKIALRSLPTKRHIDVLPLRIDPDRFRYKERTITFPIEFIHIAYYSPIKDQVTMLKAFAKVAAVVECRLTIIGSGYDVPEVEQLLRYLNIDDKVIFSGVRPQSELPTHFDNKHILLHTARFETGCAVIQEAMASGVVVAGTDVGILADIGDQYALIVPPKSPDELAQKIIQLIHDPEGYRQLARRAYEWIITYDAVWSYQNYKTFLTDMVEGKVMHKP